MRSISGPKRYIHHPDAISINIENFKSSTKIGQRHDAVVFDRS